MFLICNKNSTKVQSPAIHTKKCNNKKYRMIKRILIPILNPKKWKDLYRDDMINYANATLRKNLATRN